MNAIHVKGLSTNNRLKETNALKRFLCETFSIQHSTTFIKLEWPLIVSLTNPTKPCGLTY